MATEAELAVNRAWASMEQTAIGNEVSVMAHALPVSITVLPFEGDYAGAWPFNRLIFPVSFLKLDAEVTGPWLAHESTHQLQNRMRGLRTPLQGTLYREVEADIIRYGVYWQHYDQQQNNSGKGWAKANLVKLTGPLEDAYAFMTIQGDVYKSALYRWKEPEAESAGWRTTLAALGFATATIATIEQIISPVPGAEPADSGSQAQLIPFASAPPATIDALQPPASSTLPASSVDSSQPNATDSSPRAVSIRPKRRRKAASSQP